jgi:hypothetical protein
MLDNKPQYTYKFYIDDAGNIPKNSLTTKLGYHLPGPFEGAIPKTVVEIET